MNVFEYDFGYAWPWTLGHLLAAVVFGVLAAATWRLAWRRIGLVFLVLTVWAIAGASIVHFVMRFNLPLELPFADASFDAAVSAYAIDHLNREGVARALAETKRVLRPGGQFLLMVINPDAWIRVALPFFFEHGYFGSRPIPDVWRERLTAAGLEVVEQGTRPGTLYILSESSN